MRFYIDALNVNLYTPILFTTYDVKASALILQTDINNLLNSETGFDTIVKPFEKFKYQDLTIPQEWKNFISLQRSINPNLIINENAVRANLAYQYDIEMNKKQVSSTLYKMRQCLIEHGRTSFVQGDLIYYTTTITYPTSISRIYLMECIII